MSFRCKLIVFWLLLITLPLQGFAAVSRGCVHAHIQGALAPAQTPSFHEEGKLDKEEFDGVQTAASERMEAEQPTASNQQHHGASQYHKASCAACYACCFGTALPPVAVKNTLPEGLPSYAAHFIAQETAGFLTSGIERPPKISLV